MAQKAIQLAEASAREKGIQDRTAHVGFYLIDKGLAALERAAKVRRPWQTAIERSIHRFPLAFYAGGVLSLTALGTFGFIQQARALEVQGWKLAFFTLVFLLCASQLAVALMNWLSTLLVKPRLLPRLDYSAGIAPECRTMVVVPTMLTSSGRRRSARRNLGDSSSGESGPASSFRFADRFPGRAGGDPAGRQVAASAGAGRRRDAQCANISPTGRASFFCSTVRAAGTPGEGLWMGYERKRGKLTEFNALLRGGSSECFSEIVGDTSILPAIKYVITLDTDTQLPRDAARQLVGTMAHPLEPAAVRSGKGRGDRRLRHLAAARRREPAERRPFLVRPAVCRRRRD